LTTLRAANKKCSRLLYALQDLVNDGDVGYKLANCNQSFLKRKNPTCLDLILHGCVRLEKVMDALVQAAFDSISPERWLMSRRRNYQLPEK
jgi:hypothetical protein